MNIIYFTNPIDQRRVAKINTNLSVKDLLKHGVFTRQTRYIMYDLDPALDFDPQKKLFDFYEFDNDLNPTHIVINIEKVKQHHLEKLRDLRDSLLHELDNFAVRAIGSNNQEALQKIEEDKKLLRDLPEQIDLSSYTNAIDVIEYVPDILKIEYTPKRYGL